VREARGRSRNPGSPIAGVRREPYNLPMFFVYILRCGDGSLYTGSTTDVPRRLQQHQAGQASKYTRAHLPVTLSWTRQVGSWSQALTEEHRIKALPRAQKEALVQAGPARGPDTP
jgi:putative endonuclease